jgi:hypothetical protein
LMIANLECLPWRIQNAFPPTFRIKPFELKR